MGVDWRSRGWLEYQVMLAGWNENRRDTKDDPPAAPNFDRLAVIMATHSVH